MMTLGLATLLVAVAQARTDDKKEGDTKLEGTYTIVSGEKEGKPEPEERIKGTMVRFTADTITVTDKEKKETYVAGYKLDTSRKPWVITMTSQSPVKGEVAKGLIEKDGDTVKLIYAEPGGEAPTDFKTKNKQLMFVMKAATK
jgi:uncharacterized protein (TIGR03067 family)